MSVRKRLIVANWKMHNSVADSLKFVTVLTGELKATGNIDVAIAPPFTSLYSLGVALSDTGLLLAAQNVHWEDSGAFTGEVAAPFLLDVGCQFVIIGHSERRKIFGETDETVNLKIQAAFKHGLVPIMCVGETLEEREKGQTFAIVERQLRCGLKGVELRKYEDFIIAYEPVWAIGTGKNATPDEVGKVHALIRDFCVKVYDAPSAARVRIIYGGSVKPSNSRELMVCDNVDGALVGGASLDPKMFAAIIRGAH